MYWLSKQGAHDSEILSLSFSSSSKTCVDSEEVMNGQYFLASGGRDKLIHLYDGKRSELLTSRFSQVCEIGILIRLFLHDRNFDLIESIDDHSAAVTSVKLACNGLKILSCSADRYVVIIIYVQYELKKPPLFKMDNRVLSSLLAPVCLNLLCAEFVTILF